MGDMGEGWKDIKADRQEKHVDWKRKNTAELNRQNIPFRIASDECYLIRTKKTKADFYPSTGRWRNHETGKMMRGGAIVFCTWFLRRESK